jgi:phosphoglucosamine mutase
LDYNTTGDGLATGLHLLEVKLATRKSMSELNNLMKSYPQVLINAKVDNTLKYNYMENAEIKSEIERIESIFKGEGRLVRVMIEGKDQEEITRIAKELVNLIESKLK